MNRYTDDACAQEVRRLETSIEGLKQGYIGRMTGVIDEAIRYANHELASLREGCLGRVDDDTYEMVKDRVDNVMRFLGRLKESETRRLA